MPSQKQLQNLRNFVKLSLPICLEYEYSLPVICAQWALESKWGERESGKHNLFGLTHSLGKKTRKRIGSTGFSWVTTREELTKEQIEDLDVEEKARILSIDLIPKSNKLKIVLQRRFTDYQDDVSSVFDYLDLMKSSPYYAKYYKWWLNSTDVERDQDFLSQVAGTYATDSGYAKTVLQVYNQMVKLLVPLKDSFSLPSPITAKELVT